MWRWLVSHRARCAVSVHELNQPSPHAGRISGRAARSSYPLTAPSPPAAPCVEEPRSEAPISARFLNMGNITTISGQYICQFLEYGKRPYSSLWWQHNKYTKQQINFLDVPRKWTSLRVSFKKKHQVTGFPRGVYTHHCCAAHAVSSFLTAGVPSARHRLRNAGGDRLRRGLLHRDPGLGLLLPVLLLQQRGALGVLPQRLEHRWDSKVAGLDYY